MLACLTDRNYCGAQVCQFSDKGVLRPRYCRVVCVRTEGFEQQCEAGLEFLACLLAETPHSSKPGAGLGLDLTGRDRHLPRPLCCARTS